MGLTGLTQGDFFAKKTRQTHGLTDKSRQIETKNGVATISFIMLKRKRRPVSQYRRLKAISLQRRQDKTDTRVDR